MKKQALFVLALILCANLYSQEQTKTFELSVGPTLSIPKTSKLTNSDVNGAPEIKSSINIGAFILPSMNYSFNEKTSLDLGLGFFLDRFSIEDKIGVTTNNVNRNIGQLQIPVNVNFHFGNNRSYSFGLGAFSSLVLFANEKGKAKNNYSEIVIIDPSDPFFSSNSTENYSKNIKEDYNTINFGAFIQLKKSLSFSTNTNGFIVIRINQYFNAIKNKENSSQLNEYIEAKNEKEPSTINFGIGLLL